MIQWTAHQLKELSDYLEKRNPGYFSLPSFLYRRDYAPESCYYELKSIPKPKKLDKTDLTLNYTYLTVLFDALYEDLPLYVSEKLETNLIIEWRLKKRL